MYRTIYNILDKNYALLNKLVPIVQYQSNPKFLHNLSYAKNNEFYNKKTFEGYLNCGAVCYFVSYLLNKNSIENKMVRSVVRKDCKNFDHVFIMVNDYIIDPTYRQLFRDNDVSCDIFMNYLYNTCDYFFIGKYGKLETLCNDYTNFYKKENNEEPFNIISHYQNYQDISYIQDLDKVIHDKEYAKVKGKCFEKLNLLLNHENVLDQDKLVII